MKDIKETMRMILSSESKAIEAIPVTDGYEAAIDLIVERVHKRGGKVVTSGMGKAGQIAMNIATTFSSTGTPAVHLHPSEAQHGDLGVVQPNDVLLAISNSGKTREILELITLLEGLYSEKIPVIAISGNENSELSSLADVFLWTGGSEEVCPLGLTPTTSTTVMTVMGDVLVVGTMNAINFSAEEYARRHHGGYLGAAARNGGMKKGGR